MAIGSFSSASWRKKHSESYEEKEPPATIQPRNNSNGTGTTVDGAESTPSSTPPDHEKQNVSDSRTELDPMSSRIANGVEYKSMAWWQAGAVMVAETISLGILSLPQAMAVLGIVPGLILLICLGAMASYSGFVIGQFKIAHPHIHSMGCAGGVLFGRWGSEILGWGQFLFYVFIMGSHILTFAIMMNAITEFGACTILWMVIGTILSLIFTLPRTLKHLSYYSVVSFLSIIGAVMITMIGVSITKPGTHLVDGKLMLTVSAWPKPGLTFHAGFLAVANMVFAYAGHVAFFTFISELKNPKDFPKALAFLQVSDISMYIITAVVIYYYAGDQVKSPALDSATEVVKKVAYGIAIPTIVIAGVVNGHVGVKYIYVRLLRDDEKDLMHQRSWKSYGLWVLMCTASWVVAWIIAEVIPVFNDLLGLTSALFASWFTFGLSGMFWMKMNLQNHGRFWQIWLVRPRVAWTWVKTLLFLLNLLNIITAAILCFVGLYASGRSIAKNQNTQKPFSCNGQ